MSFYVDFKALSPSVAEKIIRKDQTLPSSVKVFLLDALGAAQMDQPVHVKASGHLYDGPGSHQISSASLSVEPLEFTK